MKQSLLNMTSICDTLCILYPDNEGFVNMRRQVAFQNHGDDDYFTTKCETHDEPITYHLGYYIDREDRTLLMGFTEHGEPYAGF